MRPAAIALARQLATRATLAVPLVIPLYFAVFTNRVFEPEKAAVQQLLALLAVAAGALAVWSDRSVLRARGVLRQPIVLAALALWTVELLSTLLSVAPATSLLGGYARGNGLATTTALLVILMVAATIGRRPSGPVRLAAAIGAGVFPAGLYGVLQWPPLALDPLPWSGDALRVFGASGNSVLLAAYLVTALPFTAWCTRRAWRQAAASGALGEAARLAAWLITLAVGLAALLLASSRGPLLGLGTAVGIVALVDAARWGKRRQAALVALIGAAALALLLALNTDLGRQTPLADMPVLDRLSVALDPERSTTRVRLRLWEGTVAALEDMGPRAALGHGPETMPLVWAPFYPPILAYDEPRGWVPDRAHNVVLDTLLTRGLIGLGALIALFTVAIDTALRTAGLLDRPGTRREWLAAWSLGGLTGAALVTLADGGLRLAGPALGLGAVVGLALWLMAQAWRAGGTSIRSPALPQQPTVTVGFAAVALAAVIAHWVELQVGFAVVTTQAVLWLALGALAGHLSGAPQVARRDDDGAASTPSEPPAARLSDGSDDMASDAHTARARRDGSLAALAVGTTLVFSLARADLVAGGAAAVALIVVSAALVTAVAVGGRSLVSRPRALGMLVLPLTLYALGHIVLLDAGARGPADALPAAVGTLAWYVAALVMILLVGAVRDTQPVPAAGTLVVTTLAVAAAVGLAATTGLSATVADAADKEAREGWQAHVQDLRLGGEPGKATSFLDRARRRYELARRLAPFEPTYALALARAATERADLLDERLTLAKEGGDTAGASAGLSARSTSELLDARDAAFARALAHADAAAALAPGHPEPALVRARTLRLWADRTRDPVQQSERLTRARQAYDRAAVLAPNWPEVLDEAAAVELLRGTPQGARRALALTQRARAMDRFYVRAWRTAGSANALLGRHGDAAHAYRTYFEDDRNAGDLPALRAYLETLTHLGREAQAIEIAEQIVRLAPADAHAHADYAVLLEQRGDLDAARVHAGTAAELDPDDPAIADLVRRLDAPSAPSAP